MADMERRVVITGVGVISPLGNSVEALEEGLYGRRSGVAELPVGPAGPLAVRHGAAARQFTGEIDDFGPLEKEQKKAIRKGLKVMCRECQTGVAAAQLALADAGLKPGSTDPDRCGVAFGVDHLLTDPEEFSEGIVKCMDSAGRFDCSRWGTDGLSRMPPLWLLKYLPNMPASHLAIYNDFRGPNNSLTMREAAACAALDESRAIIRRGSADIMLVGATGNRLHPMKMIHAVQQEEVASCDGDPAAMSRPFDRDRRGMVLGEGAGAVVLEELSAAHARGAKIYGEVLSGATGASIDRRKAMENVLRAVLQAAKVDVNGVGHLNAHGLGTRRTDAEEAQAIAAVFAARNNKLPVTAAKGNFGQLGAGGGMVELIAGLLALRKGRLFPTLNYENPDPECPVAVAVGDDVPSGERFIKLGVTPLGQAAAVLIGLCD
jgi:3-oxoacyl-[acyl-carrier-protein] synthase II